MKSILIPRLVCTMNGGHLYPPGTVMMIVTNVLVGTDNLIGATDPLGVLVLGKLVDVVQ